MTANHIADVLEVAVRLLRHSPAWVEEFLDEFRRNDTAEHAPPVAPHPVLRMVARGEPEDVSRRRRPGVTP